MAKRLSRRNAHRLALHYAICERDSFADAYHPDDEPGKRAAFLASEFRRVLKEEFGEITSEDRLRAENYETVSIMDLVRKADD